MDKLIIEAAVNESATKEQNPHLPYGPDDVAKAAIECADAGASIVHFHPRDSKTGAMISPGTETYAQAMRVIRKERPHLLVFPAYITGARTKEETFSTYEILAKDPTVRLNMATLDAGAVNLAALDERTWKFSGDRPLFVSHEKCMYLYELAQKYDFPVSLVVREPGHIRQCVAYYRTGVVKQKLFFQICLSERNPWGMPPTPQAVQTYLSLVPQDVPHLWMTHIYGQSHTALEAYAIASGGHVRTGIGDNPIEMDGSRITNAEKVARVVDLAKKIGRPVATPQEAREIIMSVGKR